MIDLRSWAKTAFPASVRHRFQTVPFMLSVLLDTRNVHRECPLCGYVGKFSAYGRPPRYDAECKRCSSLERHRLIKLAFDRLSLIDPSMRILHFAPEPVVARLFQHSHSYRTADLCAGRGDMVLNIEAIALPDASQDIVIANHVLEHVDDRKALAELFRILAPGGLLVVTVPMVEGWDTSYENDAIRDGASRTLHFGQRDHVRLYGRDFRDRVRAAGFDLLEYTATGEECVRYSLEPGSRVFVGRKPPAAEGTGDSPECGARPLKLLPATYP